MVTEKQQKRFDMSGLSAAHHGLQPMDKALNPEHAQDTPRPLGRGGLDRIEFRKCPIETAFGYVGKKWAVNIIRDMFLGKKRFSEFLKENPNLSTKMLSARLKELEKGGFIEKKIVSTEPVRIEYKLTKKGEALRGLMYESAVFAVRHCREEVFLNKEVTVEKAVKELGEIFKTTQ